VQCIDIKLLAISNKTAILVCDMLTRVHVKNLPMVVYLNGIKDFWMAEKECMMIQRMVNPNPQKRMKAWKNFENQWAVITI